MHNWLKISLLLSVFGFLKEIRPSEPFVYEYLIDHRWRNITEEQVNQEIYPIGTYSYLANLIVMFLFTDLFKYRPLIILSGFTGIIIWVMLIWTKSFLDLQIIEVLIGIFYATEVAYFTYIYAKVDAEFYPLVTSHTRAAILAGRAISGLLAQFLISFNFMNYKELNYITFAALLLATLWSLLLPPVQKSIYFHRDDNNKVNASKKIVSAFKLVAIHFCNSFSNAYVLKWSLWFALSTCCFIQVQTYMQPLWSAIVSDPNKQKYNGVVEAVLTLLGFAFTLLAGVLKTDWQTKGDLLLSICSLLQGFVLLCASSTNRVVLCYICYVLFGTLYHFMVTVASTEIAKNITDECYGLVFGVNTFVALVFQSALTTVVVTRGSLGFALNPRDQYFVYGWFQIAVSTVYIVIGLATWLNSKNYHINAGFKS